MHCLFNSNAWVFIPNCKNCFKLNSGAAVTLLIKYVYEEKIGFGF